jgi:site-specific DNA-cytosine methylase
MLRRITPIESERLMAWPDDYTAKGINDNGEICNIAKMHRYQICGNGMVASVTKWIGSRLPV